jgi:hypothetical protein
MDDNKDPPSFAEIRTAANHARNVMLSGYIRYIARAITVLARRPAPGKRPNLISAPTTTDDGKTLLPSRRINDLLWKRVSSKAP